MSVLADLAWRVVRPSLRVAYDRGGADVRAKFAAVMSPDQLRLLADWFDTDDEFKETMFPETWSPGSRSDEVQRDLRRFADLLDGGTS